eukprot:PITA_13139
MRTRGNENENEDVRDTEPIFSRETVAYSDNRDNSTSEDELLLGDIALVHTRLKITGKGTQKFVHRSCLDYWRAAKEGFAFAHCTECRAMFYLRANVPPDRWWSRLKFQLLVIRDHTAIFIVVQVVVALLGMLVYKFYGEELREMFGYEQHPYGFYLLAGMISL